jgi:hypothetical protein
VSLDYTIPDEPAKTNLGHLVVRPGAPLLAAMLCGAWLAWPWFVFNAFAMGSPTRRKELAMCLAAVAGTAALGMIALALIDAGIIESKTEIRLAALVISTWKLGMAYWVMIVQSRTFNVYTYYGGRVRSGYYVLAAGYWIRPLLLGLVDDPLLIIIIAGGDLITGGV